MVPTVLSGGCRIHYLVRGEGRTGVPPLLLLPGWGCDTASWGGLLDHLAAGRRCIAVEHRGSGASGRCRRLFGIATMADDAARVLAALGVERADVLGNSLGGMVGQALAVRHRARVRSLVLLSSSPGVGGVPSHPRLLLGALRALRGRVRPRVAAGTRANRRRFDPAQLGATLGWFGPPVLSRIRVPTLVVHGSRDSVVPAINARLMARLIPRARLRILPDAGHLILDTHAGMVADAVTAFLDGLAPTAPPPATVMVAATKVAPASAAG